MKLHKLEHIKIPEKEPPCWLSLRLPESLMGRLESESKRGGHSKSYLVRWALEQCLPGGER